jgi:hypothetical protein
VDEKHQRHSQRAEAFQRRRSQRTTVFVRAKRRLDPSPEADGDRQYHCSPLAGAVRRWAL